MRSFILLSVSCLLASSMQAQIIHVPDDYPSIQQGIQAANPGDTVLVADDTYYEQINFLGKKPLLVASHFIIDGNENHVANTIIDGSQLTNSDSASVVYFFSGEDTTSILCGFTIRNGLGTYNPDNLGIRQGGGIFISDAGAKIIHNRITHNTIDDTQLVNGSGAGGAGIATPWEEGGYWVIVENNTIDSNNCITDSFQAYGGGIAISYNNRIIQNNISYNTCLAYSNANAASGGIDCGKDPSWPTPIFAIIGHNVISHNRSQAESNWANSAGVWISAVKLTFSHNEVANDTVITGWTTSGGCGGVYVSIAVPGSVVSNNVFRENFSNLKAGGLGVENFENLDNAVLVENNYFFDNAAYQGGGFASLKAPVILQNNVFSGNHADYRGGAVYTSDILNQPIEHLVTLINNTFFNNTASQGGAFCAFNGSHLAFNNIFWQDSAMTGSEICIFNPGMIEIFYSNLDFNGTFGQVLDGGGNMFEDPLFVDSINLIPDFESPCIDQGIISFTCSHDETFDAPGYDIEGIPRPQSGGIEMGAHEVFYVDIPESAVGSQRSAVTVYPNPTNGSSQFAVRSSQEQYVSLKIYDLPGREVAVVFEGSLPAGEHSVQFDASGLPAGIYVYRFAVGDQRSAVGKLVKF